MKRAALLLLTACGPAFTGSMVDFCVNPGPLSVHITGRCVEPVMMQAAVSPVDSLTSPCKAGEYFMAFSGEHLVTEKDFLRERIGGLFDDGQYAPRRSFIVMSGDETLTFAPKVCGP